MLALLQGVREIPCRGGQLTERLGNRDNAQAVGRG